MKILAIDTSTEPGSCALWLDGRVVEAVCPTGQPSSETLLPLIQGLLGQHSLNLAALDGIAYGAGPGAFTGLRVACGVAQGLAFPHHLPVVPVVSLAAMAWTCARQPGDKVLAVLDARMNEVYYAQYRREADSLCEITAPAVAPPTEVTLPAETGWWVVGNALTAYPVLEERVRAVCIGQIPDAVPRAAAVAELGARQLAAGEGHPAEEAWPVYVRDKVALTVAERLARGGKA